VADAILSAGQRRKAALIAALASPLIRFLGFTYRWKVDGAGHYEAILASGRQPIFSFWHGRILTGMLFWRNRNIVVITSQNFDGEWIAGIIRRFGFGTARGSTSRGGARALVQLRRDLDAGRPAAFTLDGPRGPAKAAQSGAVWLSGATGHPLLPFHLEASRAWTMKSWDRTQVPKPFATVAIAIGAPIQVPDTEDATVEQYCRDLERVLGQLEEKSRNMLV
jgi:lysophospholipid acyltransferase (LPLAT)-like uncharacterized protein